METSSTDQVLKTCKIFKIKYTKIEDKESMTLSLDFLSPSLRWGLQGAEIELSPLIVVKGDDSISAPCT